MTQLPCDRNGSDPFADRFAVPVNGGDLHVVRAGSPPETAAGVVLAAHGVTASLMTWRTVARRLPQEICLIAPDLRGRGRSAGLPGPFGMEAHVDDLIAVLDQIGVPSAVLLGHSMGAYVAARLAAEHPDRVAGLILLDAGLPLPPPDDLEERVDAAVSNAIMRLTITFPSADHYVAGWRAHPAIADAWNPDIEAYARYDLVQDGHAARCVASPMAVRVDTEEMVRDSTTRTALDRVCAPIHVLRAERGLFDDIHDPLIPTDALHAFAASHPNAQIEEIPGVNHYTLVMGDGPGPHRVIAAIQAAVGERTAR
jgi:lipase